MENKIGDLLVATIGPIVPITLNYADDSEMPYAVYEITESEMRTKSGVYGCKGDITLYIVEGDPHRLEKIKSKVRDALISLRDKGVELIITSSTDASSESGQWANKIELIIRN